MNMLGRSVQLRNNRRCLDFSCYSPCTNFVSPAGGVTSKPLCQTEATDFIHASAFHPNINQIIIMRARKGFVSSKTQTNNMSVSSFFCLFALAKKTGLISIKSKSMIIRKCSLSCLCVLFHVLQGPVCLSTQ